MYVSLYRKFRPTSFDEVKGQDHIVQTLKNQIAANRIGHAYLFCGTRGTGKTSVAKILAKAVNCESPVNGSPCGKCKTCQEIQNGTSLNIIEIDAASNNGVDSVRTIKEEVLYRPTSGKYKVYIIDEVHMLSNGAFNALLKTLEEPPEYVIFILATTEVNKIPITILSRCQRYDFHRISTEVITKNLQDILKKENVPAEENALRYVAKCGDGSMRDSLSLLDQCISFNMNEVLTYDDVLKILGATDYETFSRILRSILSHEVSSALDILEKAIYAGKEITAFVSDFTVYLRNLLLMKTDPKSPALELSSENRKVMEEEAVMISLPVLMKDIRILSELAGKIKFSSQKRTEVEVALIKMAVPAADQSMESLSERVEEVESFIKDNEKTLKNIASPVQKSQGNSSTDSGNVDASSNKAAFAPEINWSAVLANCSWKLKRTLKDFCRISFEATTSGLIEVNVKLQQGAKFSAEQESELKTSIKTFGYGLKVS